MAKKPQPKITVSARAIAAVAKWAHDDTKPWIHMVLFTAGEYVATDGHRMVVVPTDYAGEPFGIDAKHLTAAVEAQRALIGSVHRDLVLEPTGDGRVRIGLDASVSLLVPFRDPSLYPPYQKAIPTEKETDSPEGYALDPRYLAAIAEVNEATCEPTCRGARVTAWSKDRLGPMVFENDAGVQFVIMPVKM